jgi:uncharacterized MAPEG superfamily protein
MAMLGAAYLVGRMIYLRGYVAEPKQRHLGYMVSITPTMLLFFAALAGVVKGLAG